MADLLKAYKNLDPAQPLAGDLLDAFYVGRPDGPVGVLATKLVVDETPVRALLAGQRGVGKTTELCRLARHLGSNGRLYCHLDLGGITTEEDVSRAIARLAVELANSARIHREEVSQLVTMLGRPSGQGKSAAPAESVDPLQGLMAVVREIRYRQPVLLIDGTERIAADKLLFDLMTHLQRVDCSMVLAAKLVPALGKAFHRFQEHWEPVPVPAISLYTKDRSRSDEACWEQFKSVLDRRAGSDAFDRAALRTIIAASAGIHRDLVWTASYACLVGHQRQKGQVTEAEAQVALQQLYLRNTPQLTPRDRNILYGFIREKRELIDEQLLEDQVNTNRIIGYHGQEGWRWDVHAVLWPLLEISPPEAPLGFQ